MVFTDLTANIDLMKEDNSDYLGDFSDEELTDLKRLAALERLESDLTTALNFAQKDSDILADVAENYEDTLNLALTYKQLELYYFSRVNLGGLSQYRLDYYREEYNMIRKGFRNYSVTVSHNPATASVQGFSA